MKTVSPTNIPDLDTRIKIIGELNLDPIKIKLMCAEEGPSWERPKIDRVEIQYRRFLVLNLKYPDHNIVPTKEVDAFWHAHILDTEKYATDCHAIFGYFLHHFPYFGMRGKEDAQNLQEAFARTKELYLKEFGEQAQGAVSDCSVSSCDAEQCSPNRGHDRSRPALEPVMCA